MRPWKTWLACVVVFGGSIGGGIFFPDDSPSTAAESREVIGDLALDAGHQTFTSDEGGVTITSDFAGGRMSDCRQIDPRTFAVTVAPETEPINDSAWYAFQVRSDKPQSIRIQLRYLRGSHRYDPKISRNGRQWQCAAESIVSRDRHGRELHFDIAVDHETQWIAGQELLGSDEVSDWAKQLASRPDVTHHIIGHSVENREIEQLNIGPADNRDSVFVVARQHPPEVTGAIGMMHFVDAIAADNAMAQRFRQRYCTRVVPTMNPDGVAHGHWRCNANGVDLNRDWSHFQQPETRAVRDEMLRCKRDENGQVCLFVDFHSTFDDVFYTPPQASKLFPPGFTGQWLTALQTRFPDFRVNVDDQHNAHRSTSKAWVHRTLGVVAITYEFGDQTPRDVIADIAAGSAQEMMRLLLALPERDATPDAELQLASLRPSQDHETGQKASTE